MGSGGDAVTPGCLAAMLSARETVPARRGPLRLYRCPRAGTRFLLSGRGPDRDLLLLACADCPHRPACQGDIPRTRESGPHHP